MSKYLWAKALAPGQMGMGPWPGPRAWPRASAHLAATQAHGPMPMCPGAKALAHKYFDISAHKYFDIWAHK